MTLTSAISSGEAVRRGLARRGGVALAADARNAAPASRDAGFAGLPPRVSGCASADAPAGSAAAGSVGALEGRGGNGGNGGSPPGWRFRSSSACFVSGELEGAGLGLPPLRGATGPVRTALPVATGLPQSRQKRKSGALRVPQAQSQACLAVGTEFPTGSSDASLTAFDPRRGERVPREPQRTYRATGGDTLKMTFQNASFNFGQSSSAHSQEAERPRSVLR